MSNNPDFQNGNRKRRLLLTGAAGFIGYHTFKKMRSLGWYVLGIDNVNDYYDVSLKKARLAQLGFKEDYASGKMLASAEGGRFMMMSLEDRDALPSLFKQEGGFDVVCNLAAQAGVRYSLEAPFTYVDSNVTGFLNVLECCRQYGVQHLVYASSSSVYGESGVPPFSTEQKCDSPASLYAATKKCNELMAHCYNSLFGFPTTGLRFFTVYGPWGRPDMALFKFTRGMLEGKEISVYNNGQMKRDFTYIDDIVEGVSRIIERPALGGARVYNIGHGSPVQLLDFIKAIEECTGRSANMKMMPMQPGDVLTTWADTTALQNDYGYTPATGIREGVASFVKWYREYYNV